MIKLPDYIIDWTWRSGRDTVGIVAIETKSGMWKAYIGVAKYGNEEEDIRYIASWGSKLHRNEAVAFFPNLDSLIYDHD